MAFLVILHQINDFIIFVAGVAHSLLDLGDEFKEPLIGQCSPNDAQYLLNLFLYSFILRLLVLGFLDRCQVCLLVVF